MPDQCRAQRSVPRRSQLLALLTASAASAATTRFSNVFGDDMVLSASAPAPVWGWTSPLATVAVSLSSGWGVTTPADAAGFFRAVLPPMRWGLAAHDILANSSDGSAALLRRLRFGTVVLCSGQSNMEFTTSMLANASANIASADGYGDRVRLFSALHVNTSFAPTSPLPEMFGVSLPWANASRASVGGPDFVFFSALCWMAVRGLADALGPDWPVGAVQFSVGGTPIQFWSDASALASCPPVPGIACCGMGGAPSCLWNSYVNALTLGPARFDAALWMQGEQNAMPGVEQAAYYDCALPAMIASWRGALQSPRLPFGVFALAPYRSSSPTDPGFPDVRLLQAALAARDPSVFFVSTLDGGDPKTFSIHSPYKDVAAARAAVALRAFLIGDPTAHYLGPRAVAATASASAAAAAPQATVTFTADSLYGAPLVLNTTVACPSGLPPDYCESFAVRTHPDCLWRSVEFPLNSSALTATIAPGGGALELTLSGAPEGLAVVAARSGYRVWPLVQLFNADGVPAEPFLLNVTGAQVC